MKSAMDAIKKEMISVKIAAYECEIILQCTASSKVMDRTNLGKNHI